jgi:hypothetical protein
MIAARRLVASAALAAAWLSPLVARAGSFDIAGTFVPDPTDVAFVDFETTPDRYLPPDQDMSCTPPAFTDVEAKDALSGDHLVNVKVPSDRCAERFLFTLPKDDQGSYVARVWTRHGLPQMNVYVTYMDTSLAGVAAFFSATGRGTSDGWVEYATNEFPVVGSQVDKAYLKIYDSTDVDGIDVDALEVVRSGTFVAPKTCTGVQDPACSSEEACIFGQCQLARLVVPVLPVGGLQGSTVDFLEAQLTKFYGAAFSRKNYLPNAIAAMEQMRGATTAWQYWGGFAKAIHELHDWHTDTFGGLEIYLAPTRRLNACFYEADADLTHVDFPRDARYPDIVVSHTGPAETAMGLHPGDRLLAIDGVHPIAWAEALVSSNWGYHIADDPNVYADLAEALGGPYWTGGALIITYASTMTVLRCDAASGTCSNAPETIAVSTIPNTPGGDDVACDNRPVYHFAPSVASQPDPGNHYVFGSVFEGPVAEATDDEKIYTMVWDSLDGQGSPTSGLNAALLAALADFKANARGVILDHRAGNGGTLDSATYVTGLVRPPSIAAGLMIPMETAGYDGPVTPMEGQALFTLFSSVSPYKVGDDAWPSALPVALVLHRDGSASDYMPFGMKGGQNLRIFAAHQTAGAFSTYISFESNTLIPFQFASGDTIGADGTPILGAGVQPDEVVYPKQSDLLRGHDTVFDAALAWLLVQEGNTP